MTQVGSSPTTEAVSPPPEQAASPSITPIACSGCVQLHHEIKQSVQQLMDKFDLVYMKLETMMGEKEKLAEQMSDSGSEEKEALSPSDSRGSPSLGGSRKRKPTKETVHRLSEGEPDAKAAATEMEKNENPVSASQSPFPDPFSNGFPMMDQMSHQQQMLQFLAMVQQQQATALNNAQPITKAETKVLKEASSTPATNSTPTPAVATAAVADPQTIMEQLQASFKEKMDQNEDQNASVSRCSNCMTIKTTAWRRDLAGKLVCNACGLYYRLHRTHRPVHMRKDFIQQRFRRKIKEEESNPSAMFSQLFGMSPMGAAAAAAAASTPNAFSFLEQFNQLNGNQQEQLNTTAPV